MTPRVRLLLKILVSTTLAAIIVLSLDDVQDVGRLLLHAAPEYLLLALLVLTADRFLMSYKWLVLLKSRGLHVPLVRGVQIYCSAMVWGMFLPATVGADAVRGYMTHERGVLERLTELRARATAAGTPAAERVALDAQMGGLLRGLVARVEAYPDLKASDTVLMLQRSLNEIEAQIAAARRSYNAAVTAYNTGIETVPANLVAGMLGFTRRPLFAATADERAVPEIGSLAR